MPGLRRQPAGGWGGTPPWPVGRMEAPSFDAWAALGGAWCPVSLPHKELVAGPRTRAWVHSRQRRSQDGTTDGINTRRARKTQYYQIFGENKWRRKGDRMGETL
jgi:hypothetical protein